MPGKYINWDLAVANKLKAMPVERQQQGAEGDALIRQAGRAILARQRRDSVSPEIKRDAARLLCLPPPAAYEYGQRRLLEIYHRILAAAMADGIPYEEAKRRFPEETERYEYLDQEERAATKTLLALENEFLYWRERCAERVGEPLYVPYRVYHGGRQYFPWQQVQGEGEETGYWGMGLYVTPMPATADTYAASTRGKETGQADLPRIVYGDLDIGALDFEGFLPEKRGRKKSIALWLYHDRPVSELGPIIDPTHHRHNAYILPSVKAEASFQPLGEYVGEWAEAAAANRRYDGKVAYYQRDDGERLRLATTSNWSLFDPDPYLALREWRQRYASPAEFRKEQRERYARMYAERNPVIQAKAQERIRKAFFAELPFRPDPKIHDIVVDLLGSAALPKNYCHLLLGEKGQYYAQRKRIPYVARIITRGKNRGDRLIYHRDNLKKPVLARLSDSFDNRPLMQLMPRLQAEYDRLAAEYQRQYGSGA